MIKNLQRMLVGFIFALPVLGFITVPDDYVVKGENRLVGQFPEYGSLDYFSSLQNYIKDRILFKIWANENFYIYYKGLFNDFNFTSSQFSIYGEEGWMFSGNLANFVYSQHCEDLKVDVKKLEKKLAYLKSIKNIALSNNSSFDYVIGPDKHGIYPEYMNPLIRHPGQFRLFEKIKPFFSDSDINVIDMFDVERQNKDSNKKIALYFTDDTHWNSYGAYFAFEKLMNHLEGNNYKPFKYVFEFKKHENGDLVGYISNPPKNILDDAIPSRESTPVVKLHWFSDNSEYEEKLKLTVNLNYGLEYFNENAKSDKTILLIVDSFGFHMSPYFIDYYSHVVILHRQKTSIEEISSRISTYKPDHVLYVNVERNAI